MFLECTVQCRQVIVWHGRVQMMLNMVIHMVRKQQESRQRADEVGARRCERRGFIMRGTVFTDRAQAQNSLYHGDERHDPQEQIPLKPLPTPERENQQG